jgi:L-amino acid N-acyltransferase YncA
MKPIPLPSIMVAASAFWFPRWSVHHISMLKTRPATLADAAAIQAIYAHFVESTTVSFEEEPPDVTEIESRFLQGSVSYPWLVAENDGEFAGYAYASAHRNRASYRWSVDTTIYLAEGHRGRGIGKALYAKLIEVLRQQGFYNAFGGVALPNPASIRLHESLGFKPMALYENVGYKFGGWHSVCWLVLPLREPSDQVTEPIPFSQLGSPELDLAL